MAYERFSKLLEGVMRDAGMNEYDVQRAVEADYAGTVRVNRQDVQTYLAGNGLPKLPKLAAICDVCAATHSQIAALVRSAVERA